MQNSTSMATPFSSLLSKPPPKTHLLFPSNSKPIFTIKPPTRIPHLKSSIITFSSSSSRNERTPSPLENQCPVPLDQQPINEFQSLSNNFPYSWASSSSSLVEYYSLLFVTGSSFALFIGLPVCWFGVVNPESQPLKCVFGALSSGLFVTTIAVLHIYLAWVYVGNRLLSATIEYEETGWYDGQIWVKTAEVLARDRLLGSYSVKPVLNRMKFTLVGLAASLVISVLLLINTGGNYNSYVSEENGGRVVSGVYSDESARSFEPDAFCGEPAVSP